MTDVPDRPDDERVKRGVTRREVVRGAVGAVSAVAVGSATVTAHEEHQATETEAEGEPTGTGDEDDRVFSTAVVRDSAPKLGRDSFVGVFIHITGTTTEPDESGIGNCPSFNSDQPLATLRAQFLDIYQDGDWREEEGVLFIDATNPDVEPGKLFIVNRQDPCGESHVELQLEQIGASRIDVPTSTPTETASGRAPGFGPLAAVTGLALGATGILRRMRQK